MYNDRKVKSNKQLPPHSHRGLKTGISTPDYDCRSEEYVIFIRSQLLMCPIMSTCATFITFSHW